MGYPTDDDFAEAHGWRKDRPSFSEADRQAQIGATTGRLDSSLPNVSQPSPRVIDNGYELEERQRQLREERQRTKAGVREQFDSATIATYKGYEIHKNELPMGGYSVLPDLAGEECKNWTSWTHAVDAIDRQILRDDAERQLRVRARARVERHVNDAVSALGGEIRSRQILAVMEVMVEQEYRLMKLEAKLNA